MPILNLKSPITYFSALQFVVITFLLFLALNVTVSATTLDKTATFVGSQQCSNCHQQEVKAWQGSHHAKAMQHASNQTILADFNQFSFQKNTFFKKTSTSKNASASTEFWVNIKGPDGKFHDYQIKYTFGVTPLQQYMVEFDDGRVQLIPFAWDSRPKAKGGQRWFNLYPDMTKQHQEFFWTNTGQNWNYMCADCHSTNVQKNFDLKSNSYNTTFSEINVGCESCHGAASEHINWTKDKSIALKGFGRNLASQVKTWQAESHSKTLQPANIEPSQQVVMCAQCHSRRTQISDNNHVNGKEKNNAFGERYLLDLISSENYHADGQVYNEDFVYGSFLQSKMYQKGVVCSNCHDVHSAKLKMPVETLCLQCHQAQHSEEGKGYAQKSHHQHNEDSAGAQCVSCHMPQTTYMQIDARRDHSFTIPRPDLALQQGTPDTCLSCHNEKDSTWSLEKLNTWFPHTELRQAKQQEKDYSAVFSATTMSLSQQQWQGVSKELSRIAQTISYSPIIRASALTKMASISNTNTVIAIARAAKNENEFIRLGAVQGSAVMASAEKWRILSPLLTDKVLAVRTASAFALASLWQQLSIAQQKHLTPALNEYLSSQDFNNDRSFAHSNKGIIYSYQGKYEQAITAFKQGISIEPNFAQTYINLSQVYRQAKKNKHSLSILTQGLQANPDDAQFPFELAMANVRAKNKESATQYLIQATKLAPQNSHYFYVLGLSAELQNKTLAYKALMQAYNLSTNPQHLYALCEMQVRHQAFQANQCLTKLSKLVPATVVEQLKAQLIKR